MKSLTIISEDSKMVRLAFTSSKPKEWNGSAVFFTASGSTISKLVHLSIAICVNNQQTGTVGRYVFSYPAQSGANRARPFHECRTVFVAGDIYFCRRKFAKNGLIGRFSQ